MSWVGFTPEKKKSFCYTLLRGCDNIIDTQFYPVKEGEIANKKNRPIGIGVINYANLLASNKLKYTDKEALEFTNQVFDDLYYHIYEASNILGAGETYSWKFEYSFDKLSMKGQLGLVCGEEISYLSDYGYHLMWAYSPVDDMNSLYQGVFPIDWSLTEEGTVPSTLTFDPAFCIWLYVVTDNGQQGYMDIYSNVTLTRN